jgi:hypothetical protein
MRRLLSHVIKSALVLMAFMPYVTYSQDLGLDLLGLQHPRFPVKDTVELIPQDFVGGNLDWTFGTSLRPIRAVLATGRVKLWRSHFFNGPGLRNGQLGRYEPHFGYSKQGFSRAWERNDPKLVKHLDTRSRKYCDLFSQFPSVILELSPTLEHNLSPRAFRAQARVVAQACPSAVIVENPVGGVNAARGFKLEGHGIAARVDAPCNVSLDGDSVEDINLPDFLEDYIHCTRFIWSRTLNLRLASGNFVEPRARRAAPSRQHLRALFEYLKPLPVVPEAAECRAIERPRLFKQFSDDKGIGDIRANKPLWITPYRGDSVSIHSFPSGSFVGSLRFFGPFDGGGNRYYSGTGTNLTPMELFDRSQFITLHEGGACFGPVNPLLRYGFYRNAAGGE